jgi:hypothetical protein
VRWGIGEWGGYDIIEEILDKLFGMRRV